MHGAYFLSSSGTGLVFQRGRVKGLEVGNSEELAVKKEKRLETRDQKALYFALVSFRRKILSTKIL